ncbi:MAG: response regulator transcription factor [Ruminococcus sp.]|jgi:DNA-binding response OmpR family regulator|nr:response regulator transcription factor [Ruminococcus sp.]
MKALILLVEDNEQIQRGNEWLFTKEGFDVMTALTLREARERMSEKMPDAIVLDIMLPDGSGLDFMRELRQTSNVPVLLLTGLTTPEDIVRGLTEGGDDYLTKPYDFNVLLARVEALLRRAGRLTEVLQKGTLKLDVMSGQANVNGVDLLLTQKEFALLLLFMQNEKQALSLEQIYEKIWKAPIGNDTRALRKQISNLRSKLEEADCDYTLNTVYGGGYRFEFKKNSEL